MIVDYTDTFNKFKILHLNTIIEFFIYFPFYKYPNNIDNKKGNIYKI